MISMIKKRLKAMLQLSLTHPRGSIFIMCTLPAHRKNVISSVGLRSDEIKKLRIVSFIQNMNLNLTSIIPGVATVLTFLVHTLLGYSLNTTEVSDTTEHSK